MSAPHHTTSRTRRDWTTEEDARLNDLLGRGLSVVDIATLMDRAETSIYSRIKTLAGKTAAELRRAGAEVPNLAHYQARKPRRATSTRKCMCCGRAFNSEGPHNRLCGICRGKSCSPYELYA